MSGRRAVIVGGDAAGMSAARQMRRADPRLEVLVLEKSDYASYGGLRDALLYRRRNRQRARPDRSASGGISRKRCRGALWARGQGSACRGAGARWRNGCRTVFFERFDYLVLATGGKAVVPALSGADLAGVYTLRNLSDGIALREMLDRG